MIEVAAEKLRLAWGCIVVGIMYAFTMLSLHFLSAVLGRPAAYHRTLWMIEHITEWFGQTGRHRKAEGERMDGEKAEG